MRRRLVSPFSAGGALYRLARFKDRQRETASPAEIRNSFAVRVPWMPNRPLTPGRNAAASVSSVVIPMAPTIHQLICASISLRKMEPVRERIFSAQSVSAKLTVRKTITTAFSHQLPFAMPVKEPFSR